MSAAGVVYVVDDDPSFRKAVTRMLTAAGLNVQSYASGAELLAHLSDEAAAEESGCVLADLCMPGLDGLSAARQIAVDPGTPVIILTAHGHPNLIDQAVEDGVISYLLKPATNPSLHAAVQVAVALAREGASVVVNDLGAAVDGSGQDTGPAHDVVAEIAEAGGKAVANGADVSDFAAAEDLIKSAIEDYRKKQAARRAAEAPAGAVVHTEGGVARDL